MHERVAAALKAVHEAAERRKNCESMGIRHGRLSVDDWSRTR